MENVIDKSESIVLINNAIRNYLEARKEIIELGEKHPKLISGNDNIIGRIGEYLAILYLTNEKNQSPEKVLTLNNKGFDLEDDKGLKTQVKIITSENKKGRTERLIQPWDQFLLISLNLKDLTADIGIMTFRQFKKAKKENPKWSSEPVAKRTMLSKKGLFKYGKSIKGFSFKGISKK